MSAILHLPGKPPLIFLFYDLDYDAKPLMILKENNVNIELTSYSLSEEELLVFGFTDDLAGAIYDIFRFIIKSIGYLIAGMIIVAVPMYLIVWVFSLFQ